MLKRIDRDNDNEISKQEWGGRSRRLFARANKDDDKDSLNEKEIKGLTEKLISSVSGRVERVFKRLDKDDDGELSEEEFSGYATFTMISRWLTPRTRPARRLQREQETKGEQPRRVRRQRPGREPGRERPVRRGRGARLMQNDADNDRKISKDEFRGPDRFFKRLDQNEDGFIDKEEINNLRNRRGRRPGQRGRRRQEGSPDDAG